ncbi:MAG: T9SS type A sorting domain-containing protein [Bacteroidota bacterium]
MKTKIYLLLFIVIINSKLKASVCTACACGNFTNATTWSCGYVPTGFDQIIIPSNFTVTITSTIDLTTGGPPAPANTLFTINGVLFFSGNSSRLNMVASSAIVVNVGGKISTADSTNNSQKINIGTGGGSEWNSTDGTLFGPVIMTNGSLPIELIEFYGTCVTNGIQLNWSTATEKNNDYFLIEKSINGMEWQFVSKIPGNGTTGVTHHYNHTDDNINSSELLYYQLSQIDEDQTKTVFKAIDVNCSNNAKDKMTVFSNPASTELNIYFTMNDISAGNILKVLNNVGQVVLETKFNLNQGETSLTFPIDLHSGTYHVIFSSDKTILPSQKILVLK